MPELVSDPPAGGYDDPAVERLYRKQRLAAAFRLFGYYGFDEGAAGHITARDPEQRDTFWVNPALRHFRRISVSDLLQVNADGEVIAGEGIVNRAAFCIHSQVHAARPDVVSAAHSHSLFGKAWSATGRLLDPLSQDATAFYQAHTLYDAYGGVVFDLEEGKRIAHALGGHKAVILRNHGLLTVGGTVEEAAWWFITMERACHAQLLAEAVGPTVKIDHEQAAATGAQTGSARAGTANFTPLLEWIVHEEPDLLD